MEDTKHKLNLLVGFIARNKTIKVSKSKTNSGYLCKTGRTPPRIMIAKMGQDGHDRGAKVVATDMPM
jgi:hypothetical protein